MKRELKDHFAWKKRTAKSMASAAARVFALRGRAYAGHGVHYALERALGSVLKIVNTFEYEDVGNIVIDEVIVEAFFKDLAEAERSAACPTNPTS